MKTMEKNTAGQRDPLRGQKMNRFFWVAVLCALVGCNVDSGVNVMSSGGTVPVDPEAVRASLSGYTMPSELSAVPVSGDVEAPAALIDISGDTPAAAGESATDYAAVRTRTYVEEQTLERFSWIEQLLEGLQQTKYEKEIGKGHYKAMVAIEEESEGQNQKQLESWVVQSDAAEENDTHYLRVRAWIERKFQPNTPIIKAEFKIYTPPTQNSDGTYQDYGVWDLNAKMDDIGDEDYFAVSCRAEGDGFSVIKLYEKISGAGQVGETGLETRVKAILYRSVDQGYGKIYYPDYDDYFCPDCDQSGGVPHKTAVYAYNNTHLAVQEDELSSVVYKDRTQMVLMTHRYGLFDAQTGDNILRTKTFGFPIRYVEGQSEKNAYYGAWQGRHGIWTSDGGGIKEGTAATRADVPPDQPPENYTVGKSFTGVLVKKIYQDAELEDIRNIPVEVWVNREYNLIFAGNQWKVCKQMDWSADPPVCLLGQLVNFDATVGFDVLIGSRDNFRKNIRIQGWDKDEMQEKLFIYEPATVANEYKEGFYEAEESTGEFGTYFTVKQPRIPINTRSVDRLWIHIAGSIYVEYKGADAGWVEKTVDYFDTFTWSPKFVPDGDRPFVFSDGMELYMDMQGTAYVVRNDNGVITVKKEIQTACNPVNVTAVLPDAANTVFYDSWNPTVNSTYRFIADPTDPHYMTLVFNTIGDNDIDATGLSLFAPGDIAPGRWGLRARINETETAFHWEYDALNGNPRITYLMNGGNYVLLDDPIYFNPIFIENETGQSKKLILGYDGWLIGLPDLRNELEKNNWVMTAAIREKIINVPAGTRLTETAGGTEYLVKPLERSLFLMESDSAGELNLSTARALRLSNIPIYVEHGMGDMPAVTDVSYSEGLPVE